MKSSEVMIGQIWSYINSIDTESDETIQLIAKDLNGHFEYKHLFGCKETCKSYTPSYLIKSWTIDPEAKGSKYFRELE